MPLSQNILDQIAETCLLALGTLLEAVTYHAKATPTGAVVDHALARVKFEEYRLHELTTGLILKEDRRMRVARFAVSWVPTVDDDVTRISDGSRWRVLNVGEGSNRIWYLLQLRRVG